MSYNDLSVLILRKILENEKWILKNWDGTEKKVNLHYKFLKRRILEKNKDKN